MKVAFVGDFLNHGTLLQTAGTAFVLLLSQLEEISEIDVYCPYRNLTGETFDLPSKIKIIETYAYHKPISLLKLRKINEKKYGKLIFDMMPTAFGYGNFSNLFGLLLPLYFTIMKGATNIRVIYHNSVFVNDINNLGYNSGFDRLRKFVVATIEKIIFKKVKVFVLLRTYKSNLDKKIPNNRVSVLEVKHLEAIVTVFANKVESQNFIILDQINDVTVVLLHGTWGPQKNLKLGLRVLARLKVDGLNFKVILSGGINRHFPEYEREFLEIVKSYEGLITKYYGAVSEKLIMELFMGADIVLLPYNAPGGHSGVLEQSMFFEVPTVAMAFPEYKEQSKNSNNVILINTEQELFGILSKLIRNGSKSSHKINLKQKMTEAKENIRVLVAN